MIDVPPTPCSKRRIRRTSRRKPKASRTAGTASSESPPTTAPYETCRHQPGRWSVAVAGHAIRSTREIAPKRAAVYRTNVLADRRAEHAGRSSCGAPSRRVDWPMTSAHGASNGIGRATGQPSPQGLGRRWVGSMSMTSALDAAGCSTRRDGGQYRQAVGSSPNLVALSLAGATEEPSVGDARDLSHLTSAAIEDRSPARTIDRLSRGVGDPNPGQGVAAVIGDGDLEVVVRVVGPVHGDSLQVGGRGGDAVQAEPW